MSAWVLPDHLADVLPSEARHIEELRRVWLDSARSYGFELVMPPLLEHLESLLTGSGVALNLQTFKLVDQLSGRSLGLRADTTPQVARIDAHLLNRAGVTRLCYCGPVVHTRPAAPLASREPLQFGAELYGHAGLEADAEVLQLALSGLTASQLQRPRIDLGHAQIAKSLLADAGLSGPQRADLYAALAHKDAAELHALSAPLPQALRSALHALIDLYGDAAVLTEAEKHLPSTPAVRRALSDLKQIGAGLAGQALSYDLADLRGYAYYTGLRFAIYADTAPAALVRGGRYDAVGEVFGRSRPAVGFGLDLKALVAAVPERPLQAAIRAPWGDAPGLAPAIASLRSAGEVVVCVLPGHEHEVDEFWCDRELVWAAGHWLVQSLSGSSNLE